MNSPNDGFYYRTAALLKQLHRGLCRFEEALLVVLLSCMIGMAVAQICMRMLFNYGLVWGEGLVKMMVLWVCMLGAMVAVRREKHIKIDLITRYLPRPVGGLTHALVHLFTAGVCLVVAYFSVNFVLLEYTYHTKAFSQVPAWICEAIIPIGFLIMGFRFAVLSLKQFKKNRVASS